ncbi:6815_t:CDS:2, partial [Acaulospora colombiana]
SYEDLRQRLISFAILLLSRKPTNAKLTILLMRYWTSLSPQRSNEELSMGYNYGIYVAYTSDCEGNKFHRPRRVIVLGASLSEGPEFK